MTQKDDGKIDSMIAELWQRHLPLMRERLDVLDRTAADAASGMLSEDSRAEALSIAHKLAGNLGMFGYHQGSEIASEIEQTLKEPTPESLSALTIQARQLREALASGL
jgi:HPt (histidine-containing phosphotransfer) domain-containing protein